MKINLKLGQLLVTCVKRIANIKLVHAELAAGAVNEKVDELANGVRIVFLEAQMPRLRDRVGACGRVEKVGWVGRRWIRMEYME